MLQFVTVSLGTPQLILFSSLLSRENASLERRFGALNALASNINGFDIKGKLNEIYDKYKGPLWGKVNDPSNYGQIIAEISSTQPGSNKIGTYTVPGSGITHVTSSDATAPSLPSESTATSTDAQAKGSLPIGGKAGDLAPSSSRTIRATSSPSEKYSSASRGRNGRKTRSRRHRSRHHSHHRHHGHHHHHSPYSSHSVRRPHSPYSSGPYSSPYTGGYDPYYSSASTSSYSRHQPHLPPPPPHPSIISSPYYPQAHSQTQYTSVPPAILGAQIGASLSQQQSQTSPVAQSSSASVKDPVANVPSQFPSPILPGPGASPGGPFPYQNVAAISGLPAMNNQLLNALLLNQLALASATTTTTPAPSTTKKPKGKKSSKKDASGKTVALTTSINTEDGTISIGGIDPEHVIKLVGGVVQSTGLNKALGSALNTVMSTVTKVGSQVVKQAVHSISDSVTFSLGQNGQIGPAISSRVQTKRRRQPTNNALKMGQALFQLRNQDEVDESEINAGEEQGDADSTSESLLDETEEKDDKDEGESDERVRREKETPSDEDEGEKLVKRSQRKRRVNKIRINRIKPGQNKDDSNVRTLTLGGTNISLRNTEKGGFSISIGEPGVPGDRRKDQGFVKEPPSKSANLSSTPSPA